MTFGPDSSSNIVARGTVSSGTMSERDEGTAPELYGSWLDAGSMASWTAARIADEIERWQSFGYAADEIIPELLMRLRPR